MKHNQCYLNSLISLIVVLLLAFFSVNVFASDVSSAQSVTNAITSSSSGVNEILGTDKYDKDISVNILQALFGGLPLFGAGEDGLQKIITVFNLSTLLIGGILGSYSVFLGMVATAQEGKFLGAYSSSMMPLRVVFGVAFVLPIANGYALIQLVIMWLVLQGISLANYSWSTFVDDKNLASALSVAPVQPEARMLAKNILVSSLCMAAINKQAYVDGDNIQMAWSIGYGDDKVVLDNAGQALRNYVANNPNEKIILQAGEVKGRNGIPDNACGSIVIHNFNSDKQDFFDGVDTQAKATEAITIGTAAGVAMNDNASFITRGMATATGVYSFGRILGDTYRERKEWKAWVQEMGIEHANATDYLLSESYKVAVSIINNVDRKIAIENHSIQSKPIQVEKYDPETGETIGYETKVTSNEQLNLNDHPEILTDDQIFMQIDGLAQKYQNTIRAKAMRTYKDNLVYDTLVKNANEYGWMLSGAFYAQMGGMADAVNQIALQTPISSATYTTPDRLKNTQFNSRYLSKLNYYLSKTKTYSGDPVRVPTVDKGLNAKENGLDEKVWASGLNISVLIDGLTQYATNYAISDQEHPIMQLKRLGSLMFATGSAILMIMMSGFGQMTDNSAVFLLSMFGYTMIGILYSGGITMSYILPMLPALIWLGMCFGWLVLVMQAMIASPLWVVMHLSPHKGDDFIGAQRNGYMLVLSLIVRPVLMVIGFIFSVLAMNIIGYFINNFFLFIYSMTQVGTNGFITAIFGIFVVPVMYCAVVYIALKEMLSIMHKVPDELLSWFGGGGQQLGGYAQKMSEGSIQAFGIVNRNATDPFGRMRHSLAERDQARAQREGNLGDKQDRENRRLNEISSAMMGGGSNDFGSEPYNAGDFNPYGGGGSGANENSSSAASSGSYGSGMPYSDINGVHTGNIGDNLSPENMQAWNEAIGSGMLSGSTNDIMRARKKMYPVPEKYMNDAINNSLASIRKDYMQKQDRAISTGEVVKPYSNMELSNRVNDYLNNQLLGEQNAETFGAMQQIANERTGNPDAGNALMRSTYKKIAGVSNRTGENYESVAKSIGTNMATAMSAYANQNEEVNPDGTYNVNRLHDIATYASDTGTQAYLQAGSMVNTWKKSVYGADGLRRSDPSLDSMSYSPNSHKIIFDQNDNEAADRGNQSI